VRPAGRNPVAYVLWGFDSLPPHRDSHPRGSAEERRRAKPKVAGSTPAGDSSGERGMVPGSPHTAASSWFDSGARYSPASDGAAKPWP
jgi:hypothetical protein